MWPVGLPKPLGLRFAVAAGQWDMDDARVHRRGIKAQADRGVESS